MTLKYAESYYLRVLYTKVKVKDIMISPAIALPVKSPFREVVRLFEEKKIRHLPVVNSNQEVVGVITQRDLYKIAPPHRNEEGFWVYDNSMLEGILLDKVMTPNPFTLFEEQTLAEVLEPMVRRKFGCIPIIDKNKKLVGIITQHDLLRIGLEILEEGKQAPDKK